MRGFVITHALLFAFIGAATVALTAVLGTAMVLGWLFRLARPRRTPVIPAPKPMPHKHFDLPRRVVATTRAEPTPADVEQVITEATGITRNAANH